LGDYHHWARCGAQAVTGDGAERGPGLAHQGVGQAGRAGAAQDEHDRAWQPGEKYPNRQAIDNLKLDSRPAVRPDGFSYQRFQGVGLCRTADLSPPGARRRVVRLRDGMRIPGVHNVQPDAPKTRLGRRPVHRRRRSRRTVHLRLVVTAPVVRRVLGIEGLDRLVSIYPTLEAATAAGPPRTDYTASADRLAPTSTRPPIRAVGTPRGAITSAVLWQLIDALGDGLALTGDDGKIVLVNRRCAEMFGYEPTELVGRPVETLVPADLRTAHQRHRAAYARAPEARPMGDRARLVGLRKDGATLPVEISLTPVPTATGHFVLAVIRDTAEARRREDLADLARAAVAEHTRRDQELLDRVVQSLFRVGLSLQAAADLPGELARERITGALRELDDTISDIRDYSLAPPSPGT
jgi:PAS domain S-box-containing protein